MDRQQGRRSYRQQIVAEFDALFPPHLFRRFRQHGNVTWKPQTVVWGSVVMFWLPKKTLEERFSRIPLPLQNGKSPSHHTNNRTTSLLSSDPTHIQPGPPPKHPPPAITDQLGAQCGLNDPAGAGAVDVAEVEAEEERDGTHPCRGHTRAS